MMENGRGVGLEPRAFVLETDALTN